MLTVKAPAACSVSFIIFRLLCQQDGAAEKPCSSCDAKGSSSANQKAAKEQLYHHCDMHRGEPACKAALELACAIPSALPSHSLIVIED